MLLSSTTIAIQNAAELQSELNESRCINEEADAFIEGLQDEVQDLRDALGEVRDLHNYLGGKFDAISNRHTRRKIEEVSEHASNALEFLSTYGLVAESLKVHSSSGKTIYIYTAIRLPCCGPVTSRKFICNPDVTDYVGFRLTYPRSDRLLTNSIAGRDIHPREYVNNTASLRCFIVISLVPTVVVIQMCR